MKVCDVCGAEISTKDGDNTCRVCEDGNKKTTLTRRKAKRVVEQMLRDCGLVKVRGALGGTYWE
jgi:uncharacterized Zn finger protein (UPF0148 family)